jgi:hypothetical protein
MEQLDFGMLMNTQCKQDAHSFKQAYTLIALFLLMKLSFQGGQMAESDLLK